MFSAYSCMSDVKFLNTPSSSSVRGFPSRLLHVCVYIDVCIIICVQGYMYVCACAGIVLVCACVGIVLVCACAGIVLVCACAGIVLVCACADVYYKVCTVATHAVKWSPLLYTHRLVSRGRLSNPSAGIRVRRLSLSTKICSSG